MISDGNVIGCPCSEFSSVESIHATLENDDDSTVRMHRLLEWISGELNQQAFRERRSLTCGSHCIKRAQTSFVILNAIRDAVRPYLENAGKVNDATAPRKEAYDDAFPSLTALPKQEKLPTLHSAAKTKSANVLVGRKKSTLSDTTKRSADLKTVKAKRRIRPETVTQSAWGQGNLVNLPSTEDPFPALRHQSAMKTSSVPAASSSSLTPVKIVSTTALSPIAATPQKPPGTTKKETEDDIAACSALQHLIELYCTLIESCLVPSSALELHLLIRLLTVSDVQSAVEQQTTTTSFTSILSNAERCVFLAVSALRRLSGLLRGLSPILVKDLVRCPPFVKHLPDLTEEFTQLLQEQVASGYVSFSEDQTALLTLPFKEARDSRHNYRSREEQAVYKNREETRDAFLYQLRAFLNVKETFVDAAEANRAIQKIRQSSRVVVNGLMDSNLSWFAEFVCDMLLQIGYVPIQETDAELLRIIDKDKLQKLHRRFSSKATRTDRSMKTIVADPKREASSPIIAAQQHFPGHQEFFYLFIMSADSYSFAIHFRALLVAKLRELAGSTDNQEFEKKVMDSRLLARFLGVLVFSPNWQPRFESVNALLMSEPSLDGLLLLSASGLSVLAVAENAINSNSLVLAVPWLVELLKMARWDVRVKNSRLYWELLVLLRQIQIRRTVHCSEVTGSPQINVLVVQCLETFFSESLGLTQTMKLSPIDLSQYVGKTSDSRSFDDIAITISPGVLAASNSHIDELAGLTSDLAQKESFSYRSPGAMRKLRPSIVSPTIISLQSPTASQSIMYTDAEHSDAVMLSPPDTDLGNPCISFQSKLRDSFFHQHRDLRILCEFAVAQTLKNIGVELLRNIIQPLTSQNVANNDQLPLRIMATKSCLSFLKTSLEEKIRGILSVLGPLDLRPDIVDVAVTLAVAHGLKNGEEMIIGLVNGELKKMSTSGLGNERKCLFSKETDEPLSEVARDKQDHLAIVTTMTMNVVHELELGTLAKQSECVLSSLKALNAELDDWLKHIDTNIPPEGTLRPFFKSILLLDDRTESVIYWALTETSASADARWQVLAELILSASKFTSFSRYGLRNLNSRLSDDDCLNRLTQLGDLTWNAASLSSLFTRLAEMKIVRSSLFKQAVLNIGDNENDEI